ncbi:MAG: UDP-N-acetylmuramoyl-L-alanyl-D-glutamate--2,6-diaminopimelate ligase [Acidobacteriia bacterium]|nr:UDP-N-acetylmuramoyl-L-alanyl-D-glutamate--2,6-diaminopimelate ligase [Terriglobia bacterium]
MKLGELLRGVPAPMKGNGAAGADPALEITSLAYDSRRAEPGTLFFAIQGEKADGHAFIASALERGAVAIASERPAPAELAARWVQVAAIRRALSAAARAFYGEPDSRLQLIGITGTNGKTTTAFLIESILRAAGIPAGLFGTIEYRLGEKVLPAVNTTPESLDLLSYFADLVRLGAKAAVLEASSHALAQERLWGFPFSAAVFTNLTRDHLDFHKDFEHYFAAKRRLFEGLGTPPPPLAVINANDPWGARLLDIPSTRRITYGLNGEAQVRPKHFTQNLTGLRASVLTPEGKLDIQSPLVGRANLANILAAVATGIGLGLPLESIQQGVADLHAVAGRFERIDEGQPFLVVVDYAHTDDALRNVLNTARELTRGRLIVVFGCGGDRDRTKRPLMGEAAGTLADFVVLTSDNPRSEDPVAIMNDALVGLQKTGKPYVARADRQVAIREALTEARQGDVVVLAGKGHETYQVLKGLTIPFDDREVARQVLRQLGYSSETARNDHGKP